MPFDKRSHVFDARTGHMQQVPAYDFQISDSRLALLSSLDLILPEWHANCEECAAVLSRHQDTDRFKRRVWPIFGERDRRFKP
jgi:hypothetical protein